MRGEGVRQAQAGGQLRPEQARPQDPDLQFHAGTGHRLHGLAGLHRFEIRQQLDHVGREFVGRGVVAPQRARGGLVGARRAAEPQVDAPRMQGAQRAELLGHLQRRMVGQHHAARADADGARGRGHVRDQYRGGRTGDARHVVVLGQPVAAITQRFTQPGQVKHVREGVGGRAALGNGREIEDREGEHSLILGAPKGAENICA